MATAFTTPPSSQGTPAHDPTSLRERRARPPAPVDRRSNGPPSLPPADRPRMVPRRTHLLTSALAPPSFLSWHRPFSLSFVPSRYGITSTCDPMFSLENSVAHVGAEDASLLHATMDSTRSLVVLNSMTIRSLGSCPRTRRELQQSEACVRVAGASSWKSLGRIPWMCHDPR